jgi:Fur family ferric uptake transcriptional regulator
MRRAGLKVTRPRVRVLEVLLAWGGHHTAEALHAELLRQGDPLSRASVYNVLHDLSARGLVLLTDAGPGRAYYEAGAPWHHHFVCRGCGAIADVPCQGPGKPCLESGLGEQGYRVDEAQVIFRGYCPDCTGPASGLPQEFDPLQ